MKKNWGRVPVFILVILCSLALVVPALAGQGDGSGGGKDQPLALTSSSPADGQNDVALSTEIKLTFSKNVVYMTVRDSNSKCLRLYSQDGKEVPIEVIMADDQVEFDKRRDIVIKPRQELQAGTKYTVKVAPQLESKSGVNLGQEITISFTTVEMTPAKDPEKDTKKPEAESPQVVRKDPAERTAGNDRVISQEQQEKPGEITESNNEDLSLAGDQPGSNASDSKAETADANAKGINTGIVAATALLLIAVLIYVIYRKKGKQ